VTASGVEPAEPIVIGDTVIAPGRRHILEIPVAKLPTDTSLSLPVAVVHGRRPGPAIWLSAAIHGDELNGVEIIRRVLGLLRPRQLAGTVYAVPIVNVFGFVNGTRYLPDRRDLNRSFPGSPRGSVTARLAHLFLREVVGRCQYGIDFHTGSDHRTNLPQLRVDLNDAETRRVAEAFAAPVTVHAQYRDGSLREICSARGIHALVFEGGEAHRFNENAIAAGVDGTLRVLHELGIRDANGVTPAPPTLVVYSTRWERARRSGIARLDVVPGQHVERGEPLGLIADALGVSSTRVRASTRGVVLGYTRNPLVSQGDALVHIADPAAGPGQRGPARPPS
jgi:predicted deacylase